MSEAQGSREGVGAVGSDGAGGVGANAPASNGRPIGRRASDRVVGVSEALQRAVEQAAAAARTDRPVLVAGASGCGRTHLARAIHAWSACADGPLEVLSIAGTEEALQLRALLGCAAGVHALHPEAFTGALARAGGGTLIVRGLDEARPDVRAALARALEQRQFRPEGAAEAVPLRARLIATAASADASLLGSVPAQIIQLPPLRERAEDILPLAAHFLAEYAREQGVPPVGFTGDARRLLEQEGWEGNVRELRERVRAAVQLAGDGAISAEALMLGREAEQVPSFKEAKRAFETRYVEGLLRRCSGNISRAARLAKKDRKDFYDVIRRTGVDPQAFRS